MPAARVVVLSDVVPELKVPVPSTVEPLLKVTVPVGVLPEPPATIALKVTFEPKGAGLSEEVTVVVVVAAVMVWVRTADVLVRSSVSPV